MATGWVKSLQCKSSALEDVVVHGACPPAAALSSSSSTSKKPPLLLHFTFCANSSHALRDVFLSPPPPSHGLSKSKSTSKHKSEKPASSPSSGAPVPFAPAISRSLPTLTELPPGHSSRRVVEIIFSTSWSSAAEAGGEKSRAAAAFPGVVEMLFRVHNPSLTVARFEEYRAAVRARSDDPRCAADGNEMMRFHCGAGARDGVYGRAVECGWSRAAQGEGKNAAGIRTFAGSGGAHESAGGGAGRRAMFVCRVIAGRVRGESEATESEGESVSRDRGELVVFDRRAVLPCFLIIYKL